MELQDFVRKPFYVKAVQIDEDNMDEVAKWCKGQIRHSDKGDKFIKVEVENPLTDRQTRGFVGDWVLHYVGRGYKVYTEKAFERTFDRATIQVVA